MKRGCRFFIAFFIGLLMIYSTDSAFADTNTEGALVTPEFQAKVKEVKDNSGILDGFLIGQAENLFDIKGINSIQNLVFGNPYEVWMDGEGKTATLQYGLFYETEWDEVIKPIMNFFSASYVGFVLLSILIASLRFGLKAYSPQAKADFWTDINMWVLSAFFMGTFVLISEILFGFNEAITQGIKDLLQSRNVDVSGVSIIAFADGFSVGDIFVFLAEWGLALYLNVIYVVRKILILLLMILAPIAAISLLYARTRIFFGNWIKELAGNVFLQSIHAVVLAIFAGLASLGAGTIFKLGCIIMFIPVTGLVSKWLQLGDSSSALGRYSTMLGIGGIGGAIMLARSAGTMMNGNRGGNSLGNFRGPSGGPSGGPGGGMSFGSDTTNTNISESALGSQSRGWQATKKAVGIAGGIAGATMGLPLGTGGVVAGGLIGGKAATAVTQGARNVMSGGLNFGRTLAQAPMDHSGAGVNKKWNLSDYRQGASAMWGNLAARRQFMGNLGESLGSMVGQGELGRSVGQMSSGASRDRILSQQFQGETLQDYARESPGASVQWRQTNQGSAFYMDHGGGEWRQISPYGSADPTLRGGDVRTVDYKLNDGSPWARQENGTFSPQPISNASSPFDEARASGRQMAGLSGSTPYLGRVSGAQIVGSDGRKYEDHRMDAKQINPDQYFYQSSVRGAARRSSSGKGTPFSSGVSQRDQVQRNSWRTNKAMDTKENRHSGVV